jgi:hypothetical protein
MLAGGFMIKTLCGTAENPGSKRTKIGFRRIGS